VSNLNWRTILPTLYPEGVVPLSDIHDKFFGMNLDAAKLAGSRDELPVPCMRLGSRKSPLVVSVDDLIALVDQRAEDARHRWRRLNEVA